MWIDFFFFFPKYVVKISRILFALFRLPKTESHNCSKVLEYQKKIKIASDGFSNMLSYFSRIFHYREI